MILLSVKNADSSAIRVLTAKPIAIKLMLCKNRIENHSHGNAIAEVKQIKQELAELLEEDAKVDKLRRLPLYSCSITGIQ